MRVIEKYELVKYYARRQGICVVCGKSAKRDSVFTQTINPYNLNANGRPKTRSEIYVELATEAADWKNRPLSHLKCETKL